MIESGLADRRFRVLWKFSLVKFAESFLESSFRWSSQPSTITHNAVEQISKEKLLKSHLSEGVNLQQLSEFKKFRWLMLNSKVE
jgi:hypothetical protein